MNTRAILAELEAERDRFDTAIAALDGSVGRGHNSVRTTRRVGARRRRRPLSAAAKKRMSAAMKKAWARRKRAPAKAT